MTGLQRLAIVLAMLVATAVSLRGQDNAAAGRIKLASGAAFVVREGKSIPAQVGQVVFEADGLRTESDGRVGITLKDDTRIALGPNSEMRLARFVYAPADGHLAVVLNLVRGVAAYVSGQIAKLSPDAVRLETPAAIVGVRGTSLALRVQP